MRARNLKPGLFKNELLGSADPINTLIFAGLWTLADREGRLEDRPLRIHAEINPYRPATSTSLALDWLCAERFIVRYQVGGAAYIWIPTFLDHQNPHMREPPSKLPAVEKAQPDQGNGEAQVLHGASIVSAPVQHKSGPASSLIPPSPFLIPPSSKRGTLRSSSSGDLSPSSSVGRESERVQKRETRKKKVAHLVAELAEQKRLA